MRRLVRVQRAVVQAVVCRSRQEGGGGSASERGGARQGGRGDAPSWRSTTVRSSHANAHSSACSRGAGGAVCESGRVAVAGERRCHRNDWPEGRQLLRLSSARLSGKKRSGVARQDAMRAQACVAGAGGDEVEEEGSVRACGEAQEGPRPSSSENAEEANPSEDPTCLTSGGGCCVWPSPPSSSPQARQLVLLDKDSQLGRTPQPPPAARVHHSPAASAQVAPTRPVPPLLLLAHPPPLSPAAHAPVRRPSERGEHRLCLVVRLGIDQPHGQPAGALARP